VINGFADALDREGAVGLPLGHPNADRPFTGHLILTFLRGWKAEANDTRKLADPTWATKPSAMESLELARPYLHRILAVGLASGELTGEPKFFTPVYKRAKFYGIKHAVAHAGEEGSPVPYVKDALDDLLVERLDHGVRTLESPEIVARVRRE